MASDICFLHFRIHDSTLSSTSTASATSFSASNENNNSSARQSSNGAKAGGLQEWLCQLSIVDDKTTVRGLLGPLVDPERKKTAVLASCCTFQVATVPRTTPVFANITQEQQVHGPARNKNNNNARVLYAKTIQSEDLFRQGVEFYVDRQDVLVDRHYYEFTLILSSLHIKLLGPPDGPQDTHTLALSESDPVARNVDSLVEMMTQFHQHTPTADVECRFIDRNGHVRLCVRAHQAILSIYPTFSERMAQAQSNPYLRSKNTVVVLQMPVESCAAFQRMLEFIYSGKLPMEAFNPRDNEQWKKAFDLAKEFGLDRSLNSMPWMDWHLQELKQVLTEENVLEIYFAWGYAHEDVMRLCVDHVAERQHVQYQGKEFNSAVLDMIKSRFMGKPGCREFQDAFVTRGWGVYANQQQKQMNQRDHAMSSPPIPPRQQPMMHQHQQQRQRQRQGRF
ncbi:hypothetical protein EC957_008738 [Mortierella hygrophila]|uniref:BTB domain-containing protein n=1 Tax=Mortierella hygrophila TaxID=979708 RepID=A0A9P6FB25_9FUNG|nr:hypothetical protein EC957_008738 [Mortierella hygrophila]